MVLIRRLFALLLLLCAQVAVAQTFPKPPDVAAFTQVVPTFTTNGTANLPLDHTVTPMPIGRGLTDFNVPSTTNRLVETGDQTEAHITGRIDNGTPGVAGTTLTMTALTSGPPPRAGDIIGGSGVTMTGGPSNHGTTISAIVSAWNGTTGTYTVDVSQTIASEALVSTSFTYCLSIANGGPTACPENKFRTVSDATVIQFDDPIRNFSQPGQSHLHQFFGGANCNAYSTHKALRLHALTSKAAGTDINGTCYWFPAVEVLNPFGDGKNFAVKPNSIVIYYSENPGTNGTGAGAKSQIPSGTRYVFGFDMDSAPSSGVPQQYAWLKAYTDAANTTIGHTRYTPSPQGAIYNCAGATPAFTGTLKNSDGSDPFGGTCEPGIFTGSTDGATTLTVTAMTSGTIKVGQFITTSGTNIHATINSQLTGTTGGVGTYSIDSGVPALSSRTIQSVPVFFIAITGPDCFDGTNLWSTGGYKNVIPDISDADLGTTICPNNYYRIPSLVLEIAFTQYGWADRQRWDLSSDIAYRAKWSLTTTQIPPGTTFHTDWMDGWDHLNGFDQWQQNCLGVEHHTAHQCDSSQINSHQRLKGGVSVEAGAGGRSPQVDISYLPHFIETDSGWELIPANSGGMSGMKVHN